ITASSNKMGTVSMTTEANMFGFGTAAGDLIMSSKTGKLHFITGGSVNTSGFVRMTVSGSNSTTPLVGIGTLAPTSNLHVVGIATSGSDAALRLESPQPSPVGKVTAVINNIMLLDGNSITTRNSPLLINSSGDVNFCSIGGKVSIGLTGNTAKLEVREFSNTAGSHPTLKLTSDDGSFPENMMVDGRRIETDKSLLINSISKNKVGIGTTNPTSTLEVNGMDNNSTNAALKLVSGTETMLLDGNEIDALSEGLFLNSNSDLKIIMCKDGGNVGIGTASPITPLHVEGSTAFLSRLKNNGGASDKTALAEIENGNSVKWRYGVGGAGNGIDITNGQFYIEKVGLGSAIAIATNGNVGIGTVNPGNKLDVKGTIRAEEIMVSTGWSDFVFEKEYALKSLNEVEEFISQNGHLPEIPNANEVAKNGIKVGEIESKLLMKIEEMTLYLIKQEKRINELENQLKKN
ncbi:MAG TPA: hypothetical protein VFL70_05450, partial [Bacteroidia bacterium]|nr:hypothetical protein [Bacteroidia bacterium]